MDESVWSMTADDMIDLLKKKGDAMSKAVLRRFHGGEFNNSHEQYRYNSGTGEGIALRLIFYPTKYDPHACLWADDTVRAMAVDKSGHPYYLTWTEKKSDLKHMMECSRNSYITATSVTYLEVERALPDDVNGVLEFAW